MALNASAAELAVAAHSSWKHMRTFVGACMVFFGLGRALPPVVSRTGLTPAILVLYVAWGLGFVALGGYFIIRAHLVRSWTEGDRLYTRATWTTFSVARDEIAEVDVVPTRFGKKQRCVQLVLRDGSHQDLVSTACGYNWLRNTEPNTSFAEDAARQIQAWVGGTPG